VIITTVILIFPPEIPVTGSSMNYCIVAFAIVLIISTIQWFVDGRKNYKGPQLDVSAMQNGEVLGMALEISHDDSPQFEEGKDRKATGKGN
jgi:choline transport protein